MFLFCYIDSFSAFCFVARAKGSKNIAKKGGPKGASLASASKQLKPPVRWPLIFTLVVGFYIKIACT